MIIILYVCLFPDTVRQEHFFYNVSHLDAGAEGEGEGEGGNQERMLEAEFHIFKMKPRPSRSAEPRPPHHLQVRRVHEVPV